MTQRVRELRPGDAPGVYVMTHAVRDTLLKQSDAVKLFDLGNARLDGIPFESYATDHEVRKRCLYLNEIGKSVAVIME